MARAIGSHSSAFGRLLNPEGAPGGNPTLRTLSDVAAVLGFQVELVPLKPVRPPRAHRPADRMLPRLTPVGSAARLPRQPMDKPQRVSDKFHASERGFRERYSPPRARTLS